MAGSRYVVTVDIEDMDLLESPETVADFIYQAFSIHPSLTLRKMLVANIDIDLIRQEIDGADIEKIKQIIFTVMSDTTSMVMFGESDLKNEN